MRQLNSKFCPRIVTLRIVLYFISLKFLHWAMEQQCFFRGMLRIIEFMLMLKKQYFYINLSQHLGSSFSLQRSLQNKSHTCNRSKPFDIRFLKLFKTVSWDDKPRFRNTFYDSVITVHKKKRNSYNIRLLFQILNINILGKLTLLRKSIFTFQSNSLPCTTKLDIEKNKKK